MDNALWVRPYVSPMSGKGLLCVCDTGRFDMDRYGRLFVPSASMRQVEVLDSKGNSICFFGRYGNVDSAGKDSLRPVEGLPLNWGCDVAVSDTAVYVSNLGRRRVVKVRLDYQAAASCPVP